jgi:hypothetical protein
MPSLDLLAVPTVLISHIYSFLSLVDHVWLSRTASRLGQISRFPTSSPERVVLNQLPPELYRFRPRGLAIIGDDGNVPLDVTLLSQRFPDLRFLSLSNRTELRDLSRLRHLQTLRCRRVRQPAPLPLPESLTSLDYDYYATEDATRLFRDPTSQQLRSFRLQWMRDSSSEFFPTRLPDNVCTDILCGGSSLTDLVLLVNLTPRQLDDIARALGRRLTTLGFQRICDVPSSPVESHNNVGNAEAASHCAPSTVFATLAALSVSGWQTAVLVGRRAPALRALVINRDETESGPHSCRPGMQLRHSYWLANTGARGREGLSPDVDKQLCHPVLTSLKMCAPPHLAAKCAHLRLTARFPSLRALSITTRSEDWPASPPSALPLPIALSASFRLDASIESLEFDAQGARTAPMLPPSDALTTLILKLYPALKVSGAFAIPYPSLTHITISELDPTRILLLLDGFAQLHTIRLEWIAMNIDKIPKRLAPVLHRLLPTLPSLRQLHLGPHVRANLSQLRRFAARLRKVVANYPCTVSCDSDLST